MQLVFVLLIISNNVLGIYMRSVKIFKHMQMAKMQKKNEKSYFLLSKLFIARLNELKEIEDLIILVRF
jgi:hypothetical protein